MVYLSFIVHQTQNFFRKALPTDATETATKPDLATSEPSPELPPQIHPEDPSTAPDEGSPSITIVNQHDEAVPAPAPLQIKVKIA